MRLFILRLFCKSFNQFESEYQKHMLENPELFYRDGERQFTKRQLWFMKFLKGS